MSGSLEARSICSACGVTWAKESSGCSICGSDGARPRPAIARGDAIWVASFAWFTCRSCGESSSMQGLETDCKVECSLCGQVQLLDPETLREAMELAWEAGDFMTRGAFPLDEPEALRAADPGLGELGAGSAYVEYASTGVRTGDTADLNRNVRMRLSPGHPLCETCREPLDTKLDGRELVVSCLHCHADATYRRPANPQEIRCFPRAALDGSLREGALDARVEDAAGGVSAIRCPVCSAGLTGVDGRGLARCVYCNTVARIAPRLRALAGASSEPTTAPYWIHFVGASPTRQEVASRAAGRARKRAEAEARRARQRTVKRESTDGRSRGAREPHRPRRKANPMLVAVASVAVGGSLFFAAVMNALTDGGQAATAESAEIRAPAAPVEESMSSLPEPATPATPATPARPPAVQTLPSFCGCPVPSEGGGATDLAWTIETHSMMRFGSDVTISVEYAWLVDGESSAVLANDQTAPPNPIRSLVLELAVACDRDSMLVSDGRHLTRWSIPERRVVASAAAPSPFGPRPSTDQPGGECYRAVVRGGSMVFEDSGGLAHRIRIPRELRARR
jgi:hypothetical protein